MVVCMRVLVWNPLLCILSTILMKCQHTHDGEYSPEIVTFASDVDLPHLYWRTLVWKGAVSSVAHLPVVVIISSHDDTGQYLNGA